MKLKDMPNGGTKYKPRFVAKGVSQKEGVDFDETYALVIKSRMLLAIANERNMEVHELDVTKTLKTLEGEIFMEGLDGVKISHGRCGSFRSQSPRCWNKKINSLLKREGFAFILTSYAIYTQGNRVKGVLLGRYVDDMLVRSESLWEVEIVKVARSSTFEMIDFGEVTTILEMRDRGRRMSPPLTWK